MNDPADKLIPVLSAGEEKRRETVLIAWFRDLFRQRTPAKSDAEPLPEYRVTWREINVKMLELRYDDWHFDFVGRRQEWQRLWKQHRLGAWCNRLLRANGERKLPRVHTIMAMEGYSADRETPRC